MTYGTPTLSLVCFSYNSLLYIQIQHPIYSSCITMKTIIPCIHIQTLLEYNQYNPFCVINISVDSIQKKPQYTKKQKISLERERVCLLLSFCFDFSSIPSIYTQCKARFIHGGV